jgi:hypothetical protein
MAEAREYIARPGATQGRWLFGDGAHQVRLRLGLSSTLSPICWSG